MQSLRISGAIAAFAVFASGAAYAQASGFGTGGETAPAAETQAVAVAWRCEGEQCAGAGRRASTQGGLVRECKRVVAVIGPVASYKSRGRELTPEEVRLCNRAAIHVTTSR